MKDIKRKYQKRNRMIKLEKKLRKISILRDSEFKESLVMDNERTESNTNSIIKIESNEKNLIKKTTTRLFYIDESTCLDSDYENFMKVYYEQLQEVESFFINKLSEQMKDFTKLSNKMCNKKSKV
jgi:hypothetical protein